MAVRAQSAHRPATTPQPRDTSILRAKLFEEFAWLMHGFSTRHGGEHGNDFDLADDRNRPQDAKRLATNRRRFVQLLQGGRAGSRRMTLHTLRQIHSDMVWRDPEADTAGDGLLSDSLGKLIGVKSADCVPILVADSKHRAVGAIHAGWRGTSMRIAEKGIGRMRESFGSHPEDLRAVIGPSIRSCCYEVGTEVQEAFASQFPYAAELFLDSEGDPWAQRWPALFMTGAPPGHPYDPRWNPEKRVRLDLAEANRRQLLAAGLKETNIEVLPYCTVCRADLFFSHRRGGSKEESRMLAAIGVSRND